MKLRIKPNSVRFRISLEELEQLRAFNTVACETVIPTEDGALAIMRNEVLVLADAASSDLVLSGNGFSCRLGASDFETLQNPEKEGVYIKRVGRMADGTAIGFVFYVEIEKNKDNDRKHKSKRSPQPLNSTRPTGGLPPTEAGTTPTQIPSPGMGDL